LNSRWEMPRETVAGEDFLFDMLRLQYIARGPSVRALIRLRIPREKV